MNPRIPFRTLLLSRCVAAASLLSMTWLCAQSTPTANAPNEGSTLTYDETNEIWRFEWWGRAGRTYFLQHSQDLMLWNWLPVIDSGADAVLEWGLTSSAERFFLRLRHTDIPTDDPENADFDGDGVPNLAEILQGTNPFGWQDTDSDGLPDDWEIYYFGDLTSYAGSDIHADTGMTYLEIFLQGRNPFADAIPDSGESVALHLFTNLE